MSRRKRTQPTIAAAHASSMAAVRLGQELRLTRRRRRLAQAGLARRIGLHRSRISQVERGQGASLTLRDWFAIAEVLGRPLRVEFARDVLEPADAGHLAIQELLLRVTRAGGFERSFELATRPVEPSRSIDVGLRDDRRRLLLVVEAWNTFGDLGSALRAFDRKLAEAAQLAVVIGWDREAYTVSGCWVVRATARNRGLIARYPEVFATRFPGGSLAWLRTLTVGTAAPPLPGLVWADTTAGRLIAWRRRNDPDT